MKITIVLGTRPEIIKMASIIDNIKKRDIDLSLIHTGQHYDKFMSEAFFEDLGLPLPDYNIEVGSNSHGLQTAKMINGIEKILLDDKPDIVLVQGDTNASLAGALVSSKLHIPIGHVEAGLRSYDNTMPEEINRKVADVCSNLYFVPTYQSAINLSLEGISRDKIFVTGNTIVDACFRNLEIAKKKEYIDESLKKLLNLENILTLTIHRPENTDNKKRLMNIINALSNLDEYNIIFPIHPRTSKKLKEFDLYDNLNNLKHIHLVNPLGYLDFFLLLSKSTLILSDSGGIQEEAITLNIPILTLRYNTERQETVTSGGNILVGTDTENIIKYSKKILNDKEFSDKMKNAENFYGLGDTGEKIVDIILNIYNKDDLAIKSPEDIMLNFNSKISIINYNISVLEFEKENRSRIRCVYNGEIMEFPTDNLNLKGKFVLYDIFQ
jgi:UDP-N-acetylglucosamine 2-epimerase (non-hydrolysing)